MICPDCKTRFHLHSIEDFNSNEECTCPSCGEELARVYDLRREGKWYNDYCESIMRKHDVELGRIHG